MIDWFPLLFLLVFFVERNTTYFILFLAAILNVMIYPFTSEYSVVLEAGLDIIILISLIIYGDRHRTYQIGLLFCALFLHILFEIDQVNGSDLIFSSYGVFITGITIMQLLGVFHGFAQRIWEGSDNNNLRLDGYYFYRKKIWPEK